jgi:hypothetical protein
MPQERPVGVAMADKRTDAQDRLIDRTLALLQNAMTGEPPKTTVPPVQFTRAAEETNPTSPSEPPVYEERTASLIDHALSLVENIAVAEPKPVEAALLSSQQPVVKQPSPKERLDMERADIRKRVATFKANQQRFQREREEYYAMTMAKARATQWTPQTR